MNLDNLVWKIELGIMKAHTEKAKAVPIGFAWMYRTIPMAAAELLSGNTPAQSALARTVGAVSNFITGPFWEAGREYGQKKTIGKQASKDEIKWFDRIYAPAVASVEIGSNMLLYHFGYGTDDFFSFQTLAPSLTSYVLSSDGNTMGRAADTWMDAAQIKKENSRSWFAPNTSKEEKLKTIGLVNFVSVVGLVAYVQPHLDYM